MTNGDKLILTASKYIGVREAPEGWDRYIKKWIERSCESIGLKFPEDDSAFAWCACFLSNMLEEAEIWGKERRHVVAARGFLKVGETVSLEDAKPGDICVIPRGKQSWQGHTFLIISTFGGLWGVSGNQSNMVRLDLYDPAKSLGIRRI